MNERKDMVADKAFAEKAKQLFDESVASCSIGLIGAACFWGGGYAWPILGGLLLQFSAVVDCIDGEVARVKFLESPFGAWLDITLDTVVHIAIFLGVGIAVWKQGGGTSAPLFGGALAVGAALSFPFVTMAEKTEEQGKHQGGPPSSRDVQS